LAISDRIRILIGRQKKREFARNAGISPVSLSRYLSGAKPNRAALEKMAHAGKRSIDWILERDTEDRDGSCKRCGARILGVAKELQSGLRKIMEAFDQLTNTMKEE